MTERRTAIQETRIAKLEEANGAPVWAYSYRGASVVGAFRRYLESDDPAKITAPLRDFLMMACGFIAHFDLHGFRGAYPHAALMLEELRAYSGEMKLLVDGIRPASRVYRDGMTDAEISVEFSRLINEHRDQVDRNYGRAIATTAERRVIEGARLLGWMVVPPGLVAVPKESPGASTGAEVDRELQELAEPHDMRLLPEGQLL
jgi:hypothetical protein